MVGQAWRSLLDETKGLSTTPTKSGMVDLQNCKLIEKLGGEVAGILVMIELGFLNARDKIKDYDLFTLIRYD